MNWRGVAHLGGRHLLHNRAKIALLTAAFCLVWLLPSSVAVLVGKVESHLRHRADATPLLLGRAGSPLELVFNAVYFTKPDAPLLTMREVEAARDTGLAEVIPVYARFSAGEHRIVGTTLDYFAFRGLEIAEGRTLLRLGECLVGAAVAEEHGISPGDAVISSPEGIFDLGGVYPLRMTVCGVLAPSGSPDDRAVFVDLKTAWVVEGLGHGHDETEELGEDQRLPGDEEEGGAVRLNLAVMHYNEITPGNMHLFHFHGDMGDYPVSAAILVPADARSQALVKGRYLSSAELQLIAPGEEMDELFATVFSVQRAVLWLLLAIGAATVAIGALVFLLSHRLRREEFRHLRHLGADFATIRALVAFEAGFVLLGSLALAALALWAVDAAGMAAVRRLVG